MKKKKDIYIRSRVHTWATNQEDQLKDWAKMLGKSLKSKKLISRGTHCHYVNPTPRYCASASAMPIIVLDKKQIDKFFKKKTRKKK